MATPEDARSIHNAEQLTGSFRQHAQQAWAYHSELARQGFAAGDALALTTVMVREFYRAFFSILTKPKTEE
jgi:hypothetical protein